MPIFTSETLKQQIQTKSLLRMLTSIAAKDSHERILELAMPLNGVPDNPTKIFIRKCHKELMELIMGKLKNRHVLLAGSCGTGKSVWGTLMRSNLRFKELWSFTSTVMSG